MDGNQLISTSDSTRLSVNESGRKQCLFIYYSNRFESKFIYIISQKYTNPSGPDFKFNRVVPIIEEKTVKLDEDHNGRV